MRRAPIVLASTVAGVSAVLSFQTHPQSPAASAATSTAAGTASTAAGSTTTTKTKTKAKAAGAGGTATGTVAQNQYGYVQVKVTVSGGKITNVTPLQLPQNDPKSAEISQFAAPQLQSEVLSAQSAQIDGVSGASYTSQSYEVSLQSALDKLGFQS